MFDYAGALARVIDDVARTLPELAHVRAAAIRVSFARARKRTSHGVFASTVPRPAGGPALYEVRFYMPRFHDQPLEDKIVTILHELWHMSPGFDGTLRRFDGRTFAHGRSRVAYEAHLVPLARAYLRRRNGQPLLGFLELSTEDLARSYGVFSRTILGIARSAPRSQPSTSGVNGSSLRHP